MTDGACVNIDTESAGLTADLIKALDNPIRRSILRHLLVSGRTSTTEARQVLPAYTARTAINFHLKVLVTTGAIVRESPSGSREHVYCFADAAHADWFLTALELTTAGD